MKPKAQFEELILGTSQDLIGLKSQASCFDDWLPDIFFWEEKAAGASGAASFEWGTKKDLLKHSCFLFFIKHELRTLICVVESQCGEKSKEAFGFGIGSRGECFLHCISMLGFFFVCVCLFSFFSFFLVPHVL